MPSTTVHFGAEILSEIDAAAQRHGISRNKFVMTACERALREDRGVWPEDFFEPAYGTDDWDLLTAGTNELERTISENRRNRGAPLL